MSFAAAWMELEIIMLSEENQTEKQYYMISLICGIFKKDTQKLLYKIDSQMQKTNVRLLQGKGSGRENYEFRINRYTVLYIKHK